MDVVADLVAEQDRLEVLLGGLDEEAWSSPSAATGWTVSDVVLHLAQTEEAVVASALGVPSALRIESSSETLDGAMDRGRRTFGANRRLRPLATGSPGRSGRPTER